jgi:hypothetical protein
MFDDDDDEAKEFFTVEIEHEIISKARRACALPPDAAQSTRLNATAMLLGEKRNVVVDDVELKARAFEAAFVLLLLLVLYISVDLQLFLCLFQPSQHIVCSYVEVTSGVSRESAVR